MKYKLLLMLLAFPLNASGFDVSSFSDFSKEKKVMIANISGLSAITAWGVANWDYFSRSPSVKDEGWFADNTKEGGADKLGHFYLGYTLSHLLGSACKYWGYSDSKGALLGSLSSFAIMSWMEIGDSFSDYGFSHEDFIMNGIGAAAAYLIKTNPELSKKIDFRAEYTPAFDSIDFFTDYEHLKYLVALKLDGFESITQKYLRYLELHLGYYARGYSGQGDQERNIYVGLGINISRILKDASMDRLSILTSYIQIPYTCISIEKER
ncbi:MAG: DUF2279 domain-containing protein [Desulfamplus sp.]|nr:DUF2279 domain-containing protein [Desulfamplus sp.]